MTMRPHELHNLIISTYRFTCVRPSGLAAFASQSVRESWPHLTEEEQVWCQAGLAMELTRTGGECNQHTKLWWLLLAWMTGADK